MYGLLYPHPGGDFFFPRVCVHIGNAPTTDGNMLLFVYSDCYATLPTRTVLFLQLPAYYRNYSIHQLLVVSGISVPGAR